MKYWFFTNDSAAAYRDWLLSEQGMDFVPREGRELTIERRPRYTYSVYEGEESNDVLGQYTHIVVLLDDVLQVSHIVANSHKYTDYLPSGRTSTMREAASWSYREQEGVLTRVYPDWSTMIIHNKQYYKSF